MRVLSGGQVLNARALIAALCFMASIGGASSARAETRTVVASNLAVIEVITDEFRPERDVSTTDVYSSIDQRAPVLGSVQVRFFARQITATGPIRYLVQGRALYPGDWVYYDRAHLPGGQAVTFTSRERDVVDCATSPYGRGKCTFREAFQVELTKDQIDALRGSDLRIKISSANSNEFIIAIPQYLIAGVFEVLNSQ